MKNLLWKKYVHTEIDRNNERVNIYYERNDEKGISRKQLMA